MSQLPTEKIACQATYRVGRAKTPQDRSNHLSREWRTVQQVAAHA
jgi:hypothetical protein